ncbi:hypothetical protein [Solidesulfovibrio sp.]|uniref:hypothetical protein n=1 Tax=Solidesulfovibrio sp. TaxID=2910990 RepID=UPI002B2005FF|nr:hypothetical protein [Solidesulfovibrio sp.]MEA5090618.1 hypothetical protein [Solidesulfovibrio sp.]
MPFMRFCTVPALCLAVALAACAPATKTAPPANGKAAAGKAATTAPPPQPGQQQGFRVVMGKPLPGTTGQGTPINRTPAAPPPAQQVPAQTTPPITAGEPAQSQAAPIPMPPLPATTQAMPPATPAPAPADAAAASGRPTGFGGLTFGDAPQSQPGLAVYDAEAGDVITYVWPKGPKDVFGAPVREAFYEFYQGRFYHVWINFDGMAAYKKALAGLTSAFGPPTQEAPEKFYHAWMLGDVNVYCAFHPSENGGDVSFFYQPIYEPMMAARAKAGKTAKPAPRSKKP